MNRSRTFFASTSGGKKSNNDSTQESRKRPNPESKSEPVATDGMNVPVPKLLLESNFGFVGNDPKAMDIYIYIYIYTVNISTYFVIHLFI